jgi:hypothetical protein
MTDALSAVTRAAGRGSHPRTARAVDRSGAGSTRHCLAPGAPCHQVLMIASCNGLVDYQAGGRSTPSGPQASPTEALDEFRGRRDRRGISSKGRSSTPQRGAGARIRLAEAVEVEYASYSWGFPNLHTCRGTRSPGLRSLRTGGWHGFPAHPTLRRCPRRQAILSRLAPKIRPKGSGDRVFGPWPGRRG